MTWPLWSVLCQLHVLQSVHPLRSVHSYRPRLVARGALTFIDLTMVMLIIGILAAVSMPRVAALQRRNELRNAAMTLAEHMRIARTAAMSQAKPVEFIFNTTDATYQVPQLPDPERPGQVLFVDLRSRLSSRATLVASFNGAQSLVFGVDGLPRVAGQGVTTSTLTISEGSESEWITLRHGWGTATWTAASSGSRGAGG